MKFDHLGAPFWAMQFICYLSVRIALLLQQILLGHQRVKEKMLNYPTVVLLS